MTIYRCNDCGKTFDDEEMIVNRWREPHPYGNGTAWEDMCECLCPHCGSGDIEEDFDDYEGGDI